VVPSHGRTLSSQMISSADFSAVIPEEFPSGSFPLSSAKARPLPP